MPIFKTLNKDGGDYVDGQHETGIRGLYEWHEIRRHR